MKVRNKGKVHPSPSSYSPNDDVFSALKLLPAAILALASVLSLEDREVLAYMITRSVKSTNPSSFNDGRKKNNRKSPSSSTIPTTRHKIPSFDCECFDCYTNYWFKWDSSSNRELIHQAIEAFEEQYLNNGEQSKKNNTRAGGKKRDKMGRRHIAEKTVLLPEISPPEEESADLTESEDGFVHVFPASDNNVEDEVAVKEERFPEDVAPPEIEEEVVLRATAAIDHKGLARKVLPDILGIFNSRLWSLWSPNV